MLKAEAETAMQRGFLAHQGRKRTHVISVGEPGGANYAFDLSKGALLQIWRGGFLETTPMWHGRGETQLALPLGSVISFAAAPSLAFLADQQAAWPDSNAAYTNRGYDVTPAGRPVFKYSLGEASVRQTLEPEDSGRKLTHTLHVLPGAQSQTLWCRLAEGNDITPLSRGWYAVNDKQYFIEVSGNTKPLIRTTARNTKELLLPVTGIAKGAQVKYSIVW